MSSAKTLLAESRKDHAIRTAPALRRAAMVPGIVYGDNREPEKIALGFKELTKESQSANFRNQIFNLEIGKTSQSVIVKDIQFHPVSDNIIHIDLQRVNKNSKVNVFVPITFINEDKSPALKRGGKLNIIHHSLEISCPPHAIPESLTVDLSGIEMNHSIMLRDLTLPEGAKANQSARDNVIATVIATSAEKEEKAD